MQNLMENKTLKNSGITLMALVITIIILLILAGISLNMLAGNNGVINHTISAKEKSEISDEKEHLEVAIVQAMGKHKYGSLTQTGLSTQLEEIKNSMPTSVESDEELNLLFVTFTNSGRVYQVNSDGDVTYLGNLAELKNSATITASPESNTTPQLVQYVDLKVETFVGLEDDEIFVHYAWTNSESKTPSNTDYAAAICNVNSNKKIRSVTIKNSFGTHEADDKSWDVSASQNRTYLAWSKATTDATDGTIYDVVIEGKGGVVANTNASYLFANIGSGLTKQEVTITGLEYLDTGLTINMGDMFSGCKSTTLDVTKFDTSKVEDMSYMLSGCRGLISLDVSNFNTMNVTNMVAMFQECIKLTTIYVGNNWDTSNVNVSTSMFSYCNKLKGDISYNYSYTDKTYATKTGGYMTYKPST